MGKTRKKEVTERNYFAKGLAERTGSFRGPHKGPKKRTEKEIIEDFSKNGGKAVEQDGNKLMIEVSSGSFICHKRFLKKFNIEKIVDNFLSRNYVIHIICQRIFRLAQREKFWENKKGYPKIPL